MIKAILIDDEPKALDSLSWELNNFSHQIEILKVFTQPEAALDYLKHHSVDCIFLDIEMPTMDGFQFLNAIDNKCFEVIITTAYNEYAIKAIKQQAIDYLLKPVDTDDLALALKKVAQRINSNSFVPENLERILKNYTSLTNSKKITLNTDGKLIFVAINTINYVVSDGNYSTIYFTDSKPLLLTKKLKEVYELLPKAHFFRVHNSYIVNLDKINSYVKNDGYVILDGNVKIPISRLKKNEFLSKI